MPANLPPQYHSKEAELKDAKTPEDKIVVLQELLAIMPKHKGTEKLQSDLKTRISKLKKEALEKKATSHGSPVPTIIREGAGQVMITGPANSGKSSLLAALTRAEPEIADYPFTTKIPMPGMMQYKSIQIQLVDTPALSLELSENWLGEMLRRSDLLVFLADLSADDVLEQTEEGLKTLEKFRIKTGEIWEFSRKIIWVGSKSDSPSGREIKPIIFEAYPGMKNGFIEISVISGANIESFRETVYNSLELIRVYTKIPGKPVEMKNPYAVPRNSTLADLASTIHKDLIRSFRYARLWNKGQTNPIVAGREHVLEDDDVIEIHADEAK